MTNPMRSVTIHTKMTHDGRGALELRKDLEQAERAADKLDHRLKNIGGEEAGTVFGRTAARAANNTFGDLLDFGGRGLRPRNAAIGAIVGLAAAAAPSLGAMIAGAVTGAVGVGGIAGGIAAASNSPAVKQAAKNLGTNIASSFTQMGDQFVEPLIRAFGILEQGWHSLNLESAFEKVAAYVDDLAYGISGFAKGLADGFSNALGNAGPILSLMRTELPRLGDALGYMLDRMSQGKGVVEGFAFLMRTLDAVIIGTGNTIGWLADRFHDMIAIERAVFDVLEHIPAVGSFFHEFKGRLEGLIGLGNTTGQTMNYIGRETQITAGAFERTTTAINTMGDALRGLQDDQLALQTATHAYQSDLQRFIEQVKEHGTTLDTTTAAGNANLQMIDGLVLGLGRERDAAIKAARGNQEKVDKANAKYAEQMAALQKLLERLGFEKRKIEEIVGAYKKIPPRITTQIIQEYQTKGKPAGEHSGTRYGERGFASGGTTPAFEPFRVHEGETLWSNRQHYVATKAQTEAMSNTATGSARPLNITINGSALAQMALDEIVREVRRRGGTLAAIGVRS